jgi:hypothetical protein
MCMWDGIHVIQEENSFYWVNEKNHMKFMLFQNEINLIHGISFRNFLYAQIVQLEFLNPLRFI